MIQDQPRQKKKIMSSHNYGQTWAWWSTPVISGTVEAENRRITVQVGRGKKRDPISKITRAKIIRTAEGAAQVVE
jgi:hypothetical protein